MVIDLPDSVPEPACSTSDTTALTAFALCRHVPDREASLKEANEKVHTQYNTSAHPMG